MQRHHGYVEWMQQNRCAWCHCNAGHQRLSPEIVSTIEWAPMNNEPPDVEDDSIIVSGSRILIERNLLLGNTYPGIWAFYFDPNSRKNKTVNYRTWVFVYFSSDQHHYSIPLTDRPTADEGDESSHSFSHQNSKPAFSQVSRIEHRVTYQRADCKNKNGKHRFGLYYFIICENRICTDYWYQYLTSYLILLK